MGKIKEHFTKKSGRRLKVASWFVLGIILFSIGLCFFHEQIRSVFSSDSDMTGAVVSANQNSTDNVKDENSLLPEKIVSLKEEVNLFGKVIVAKAQENESEFWTYVAALIILIIIAILTSVIISHRHNLLQRRAPFFSTLENNNFPEKLLAQAVSGQKQTPASGWDAQLKEVEEKLAHLEVPKHGGKVIHDLPHTHGIARDLESHPDFQKDTKESVSLLLAKSIKKPHTLLQKLPHKKRDLHESEVDEEYQKILQLHWKVDHYSQLSGEERLQLDQELKELERKLKVNKYN